jgi:hypothetical protein
MQPEILQYLHISTTFSDCSLSHSLFLHRLIAFTLTHDETEQRASCCYLQSSPTYDPNPGATDSPLLVLLSLCTLSSFLLSHDPKEAIIFNIRYLNSYIYY